jgi:hypothetical protein
MVDVKVDEIPVKRVYKESIRKIFRPSVYQRTKQSLIDKFNKIVSENETGDTQRR